MTNKGNDTKYYFNSIITEKCLQHNSYTCGCSKGEEGEEDVVNNYINFYKFCSKIILFSDGKIQYVNKTNKNTMKFII